MSDFTCPSEIRCFYPNSVKLLLVLSILSICAQNLKKRLKETKSATMNIFRKKNLFFLNHL